MTDFYSYGEVLPADAELEGHSSALLRAVFGHADFEFVEKRAVDGIANMIVVDCFCAGVPTRNSVGIRNRERLALVYAPREIVPYQVRPLRRNFPPTLHRNHVPKGEPFSLCIYFQPWSALERNWTPELHLNTILWWLENCSRGTLHPEAQPLEQLYFESLFRFVLPPDFEEALKNPDLRLAVAAVREATPVTRVARGVFVSKAGSGQGSGVFDCLFLSLRPVVHAAVERFPCTLGELHDQLVRRGSEIYDSLVAEFYRLAEGAGIATSPKESNTLLLLDVPVIRRTGSEPERTRPTGFIVFSSLTKLGEATGDLFSMGNGKHHSVPQIGPNKPQETAWRDIPVLPIAVEHGLTRSFAQRSSGLEPATSNFKAVLAGVGSLGGALATIWAREGWGNWTYIDDDYIKAHNLARHPALDTHVGMPKTDAVKQLVAAVFLPGYLKTVGVSARANDKANKEVSLAIGEAQFLVDTTTTLEVPRDLARDDDAPRSASVFITPSGMHSVLLLEDEARSVRLDALEAQYYRGIIRSDWGRNHLVGHQGELWVGAGCRDVTAVIPYELVVLHAAVLARAVRDARLGAGAVIRVHELDDSHRNLRTDELSVMPPWRKTLLDWTVTYDAEILARMETLRASRLPRETGGVVVGYCDQKLHAIFIVDILEAPRDSEETETGFTRGTEGLESILSNIAQQTAHIVEYVGEWHSHPPNSSAWPSGFDISLLLYLSERLSSEGKPGLVLILGEHDISFNFVK